MTVIQIDVTKITRFPDRTWAEFDGPTTHDNGDVSYRCKACGIYHYLTAAWTRLLERDMKNAQCKCRIYGDIRDFSVNSRVKRKSGDGPSRGYLIGVDRRPESLSITIGPLDSKSLEESRKRSVERPCSEYEIDWGDDWVMGPDGELCPPVEATL